MRKKGRWELGKVANIRNKSRPWLSMFVGLLVRGCSLFKVFLFPLSKAKLTDDVPMNRQNAANRSLLFIFCTRTLLPLFDVLICDLFPDLQLWCNR